MVKVKKEVWVERCDFCEEKKKYVCVLCGNDICNKHALRLDTAYVPGTGYGIMVCGMTISSYFCPNHLSGELLSIFEKKLQSCKESAKT